MRPLHPEYTEHLPECPDSRKIQIQDQEDGHCKTRVWSENRDRNRGDVYVYAECLERRTGVALPQCGIEPDT